jgi:hypothetical protein
MDSWLLKTGIVLHLGHHGEPCPNWHPSYWDTEFLPARVPGPSAEASHGSSSSAQGTDMFTNNAGETGWDSDDESIDFENVPDTESFRSANTVPEQAKIFYEEDTEVWRHRRDNTGNPILVVVDRSGLHPLPVVACTCAGAATEDIQFLDLGLFPSSFDRIRTVFTFQVLDDYLADNQECKTSAMHYFQKLRRFTNPSFPLTVPVSFK